MKCVNNTCTNNPDNSINSICVNIDGDFACNNHCKVEYEKQRDHFFNNICISSKATAKWLLGNID